MRCSLKNKSLTLTTRNVDDYSSTFQVFGQTRRKKQVTSTIIANVCCFTYDFFCDQTSECLINSKRYYFTNENHTATLRPGTHGLAGEACTVS